MSAGATSQAEAASALTIHPRWARRDHTARGDGQRMKVALGAGVATLLATAGLFTTASRSAASALPSGGMPLNGSAFQGGDGNQADEGGFSD
jgi:hypothetical protein